MGPVSFAVLHCGGLLPTCDWVTIYRPPPGLERKWFAFELLAHLVSVIHYPTAGKIPCAGGPRNQERTGTKLASREYDRCSCCGRFIAKRRCSILHQTRCRANDDLESLLEVQPPFRFRVRSMLRQKGSCQSRLMASGWAIVMSQPGQKLEAKAPHWNRGAAGFSTSPGRTMARISSSHRGTNEAIAY